MAIKTPTYIEESFGYRVEVRTEFDFMKSNPLQGNYLFQYHITITNISGDPAQLLSRLWHIEDAEGEVRQVKGPGVIGHTPHFKINDSFDYSSFCPLPTMSGRMWGHFEMLGSNGQTFEITTPVFRFKIPEDFIDRY